MSASVVVAVVFGAVLGGMLMTAMAYARWAAMRTNRSSDDGASAEQQIVPRWLGWLAVPIAALTSIIGVAVYACWAYRRGCKDGASREPGGEPRKRLGLKFAAWGLLSAVPVLGLLGAIHVSNLSYTYGFNTGADRRTAPSAFTSLTALGAAFGIAGTLALTALLVVGISLWVAREDDALSTRADWVIAGATLAYSVFTLGALAVLLAAALYARGQLILAGKSRHLSILSSLSERWSSELIRSARQIAETAKDDFDEIWHTLDLRNSDDYYKLAALANFFEDLAILEKEGQIEFNQAMDRFGSTLAYYHDLYSGIISREQKKDPKILENFDKLAKRVKSAKRVESATS